MKPNIKKNDIFELEITDMLPDGNGVAKKDGFVIFVPKTAVGDIARIKILKVGVSRAYGKSIEIVKPSSDRIPIDCKAYKNCGGCVFRQLSYDKELELKKNIVTQNFRRIGGFDIECSTILSPIQNRYRGKAEYPCAKTKDGCVKFGFYQRGTHTVIPCEDCILQPEIYSEIVSYTESFCDKYKVEPYDETTKNGVLRYLYIRNGYKTGQVMVCLVLAKDKFVHEKEFIEGLKKTADIRSVIIVLNNKNTNVILTDNYRVIYGKDYIEDELCGLKFKINPLSFFQVNNEGAEVLYGKVKEFADLKGDEFLLDLYCGTGTIGLSMAKNVRQLIGVDVVEQAIKNAKDNAKTNGIENASFICSDAGKAAESFKNQDLKPDVIVIDPARSGCDELAINSILAMKPEKIVMVSCNSATAARDAEMFCKEDYLIKKIIAVDMFPRTGHCELVVSMSRVGSKL